MHLCAEHFFRVKVPPPPTLPDLLAFYEENWLSAGYESPEEELKYRAYGREILTRFWEIHNRDFRMPLAVERSFLIDVNGIKLRGFIDRIDKLESGGLAIIDYKSSQELFTTEHLQNDLQLTLYQLAAQELWHLPVERLTLYHMRSNTPCHCSPRGEGQLQEARELVLEVADNIAKQNFPAVENQFCPCDFLEHCPYHAHRYTSTQAREQDTAEADIPATVEEYASLQQQAKDIEMKLEELRSLIVNYCHGKGLNRLFGSQHAVTYKQIERMGFDENEVRDLLEPLGLWEKVLGLDQARAKQLLSDKTLAAEVRRNLEALKRVTSSYPQLWVRRLREEE